MLCHVWRMFCINYFKYSFSLYHEDDDDDDDAELLFFFIIAFPAYYCLYWKWGWNKFSMKWGWNHLYSIKHPFTQHGWWWFIRYLDDDDSEKWISHYGILFHNLPFMSQVDPQRRYIRTRKNNVCRLIDKHASFILYIYKGKKENYLLRCNAAWEAQKMLWIQNLINKHFLFTLKAFLCAQERWKRYSRVALFCRLRLFTLIHAKTWYWKFLHRLYPRDDWEC